MYICPKCGKYMTWYIHSGGVLCGWKCVCGARMEGGDENI